MTASRLLPFSMVGLSLVFAACGGESLTLPPDGEPANIDVLPSTDPRTGRVTETLAESLVVLVTDSRDRPVPGANVVFSFPEGPAAGEAVPASATTDANGHASTRLKLGTAAGDHTGIAEVPVDEGITPVRAEFTVKALPADAAGIRLVSGDPQTGTVNSPLGAPLVVEVTDASGNPIPNVPVQWTVEGGGTVSAESNLTLTGPDGRASVTRTLGGTAGPQATIASVEGLEVSSVRFTHTAEPGSADRITKFSGDNQSGSPGAPLAQPLVVEVRDELGNPIVGRAVSWVIGTGGGSVSPDNTPTNAAGQASTQWTLGPGVGQNTVNAVVSGVGSVTFTATATAGQPSAANSEVSAAPSTILVGAQSTITVTVRDESNNPVSGASVTVTSSGSGNTITPASASTGANGVATFTFSSTVAETKTITATAGGVAINDQATITVQKTSSTVEITDDEPDPSTVGTPITVEFTVRGTGGPPTGEVVVTLSGGEESCRANLVDGNGSCTLTPTAPGPDGNNNRRVITATYGGDARFSGDTDTENHRVNPAPPTGTTTTITSDTPDPSDAGAPVTVNFTVTSGSGTPSGNVEVTAEGGGSCTATVAQGNCQLTPAASGQVLTLTARYQGGSGFSPSEDTEEHTVNPAPPANQPPNAEFFPQPCSPDTRNCGFLDVSTDPEDGLPGNWSWNFGDPTTEADVSAERHPSYTYPAAGTYTVTLTVRDSDGATDTQTHDVVVP